MSGGGGECVPEEGFDVRRHIVILSDEWGVLLCFTPIASLD